MLKYAFGIAFMKIKSMFKTFTFYIAIFLFTSITHSEVYLVSNVNDFNSAQSKVLPGDTVMMKNGSWRNSSLVFSCNGTSDKPITLCGQTPGQVILCGTSNLKIAGNYLIVSGLYFKDGYSSSGDVIQFRNGSSNEANHCRLTNCAIVDFNPSDSNIDYKWVSIYGTYNRVDHCYFEGKSNLGTTLVVWLENHPNYHQIDSNYFSSRPYLGGLNGAETIRVGTSDWSLYDSYTTVEYNYFENCDGEIEIISNKSCNNVYRYNTFFECSGTLTLREGNNCTVEGNYFIGNNKSNTGGVRIIGENHKVYNNYFYGLTGNGYRSALAIVDGIPNTPLSGYAQVKNAIVAFNTFVNNKYSFNIGISQDSNQSLPPIDCTIANNIVMSNHSPIVQFGTIPENLTWKGNIMFGASLGIVQPDGINIIDPELYLAGDGIFRPQQSSPVVNSAQGYFPFITDDIDGQPRYSVKDIGCDQLSIAPVIRKMIKSSDVGVKWFNIINNVQLNSEGKVEKDFRILQNYPNPFNPETNINYQLPLDSYVTLKIYDILGREVQTLVSGLQSRGNHTVIFDGGRFASGVYFYKLTAGNYTSVKKMVLLK